jgi:type II secretory pathway pseudopilin PulG
VELLIVMALMGVVAAISIRSVGDTIRRDRVQKARRSRHRHRAGVCARGAPAHADAAQFDSTRETFSVPNASDTTLKYRTRSFASGDLALDYISASSSDVALSCRPAFGDTLSCASASTAGTEHGMTARCG